MSPLCESELSFNETLASLGVFSKSILKTETNKISIKLALMGKVLRALSGKSKIIFKKNKNRIYVDFPMYAKLFSLSENIFYDEVNTDKIFISQEYCEEILKDIKNLTFQQIDCFLCSFQNIPVELASDLLNSMFGEKVIEIFTSKMLKNDLTLEDKTKHFSRFLKIREVLVGLKNNLKFTSSDKNKNFENVVKMIELFDKKGKQNIINYLD